MKLTIFSEGIIFLQNYKSGLVLKTTRRKQTILSICITGCANEIYRKVFYLLETSVWRFMIKIAWAVSKGGSYFIIWGHPPPISINGTLSNNNLITSIQKTAFCKKSLLLADRSQNKFFLFCRSLGPPDPLGLHAARRAVLLCTPLYGINFTYNLVRGGHLWMR